MDRSALLGIYGRGYQAVAGALSSLTDTELDLAPGPDDWSARQIVHHLADSEATAYVRLRRLVAEDQPLIQGYDGMEFARRLHYDRPIEASLAVLKSVREASLELLESLTPKEWTRTGMHSESGTYSVDGWLEIYSRHAHDHADQIRRTRAG